MESKGPLKNTEDLKIFRGSTVNMSSWKEFKEFCSEQKQVLDLYNKLNSSDSDDRTLQYNEILDMEDLVPSASGASDVSSRVVLLSGRS